MPVSPVIWLGCGLTLLGSMAAGVELGSFAAGSPADMLRSRPALETIVTPLDGPPQDSMASAPLAPTEPVVCRGCGPTLAERQMSADAYALETAYGGPAETPVDEPPEPLPVATSAPLDLIGGALAAEHDAAPVREARAETQHPLQVVEQ
jgi:hypothetical protein